MSYNPILPRPQGTNISKLREFLNQSKSMVIVGDSITEGSNASDYRNDGFVGILRKAIQLEYDTLNHGFENLRADTNAVNKYHTVTLSGFANSLDDGYYGGTGCGSSINGGYVQVNFTGKSCKLAYQKLWNGGVFDVELDGVVVSQVYTSVTNVTDNYSTSTPINAETNGSHVIKFIKKDANPTTLLGVEYYEDLSIVKPCLHNVGRSSMRASRIINSVIDIYCTNGIVILCLGVNDHNNLESLATFQTKLELFADNIKEKNGFLLLCDFMFDNNQLSTNSPQVTSKPYKDVIKKVALMYPEFDYIDFANVWFNDTQKNKDSGLLSSDGIHPTVIGHESIANEILKHIGLPYTKQMLIKLPVVRV